MCGIHFVINADDTTSKLNLDKFLSDAFFANQVRGTDSSGMFQIKRYNNSNMLPEVSFYKEAMHGSDFLKEKGTRDLIIASNNARATICHVRAATQGGVNPNNAHPFIAKREDGSRIIGVHNGTLLGWRGKEGASKHSVDSQWLFSKLASDGAEAFKGFDGAWALVWYDNLTPDIMYIARNDKRPIFYAYSEDKKAIIGASELGMLGWLAERNGITLHKNEKGVRFFYPPAGQIMETNIKTLEQKFYPYAEYKVGTYALPPVATTHSPVKHTYNNHTTFNWQDSMLEKIKAALETVVTAVEDSDEVPFMDEGEIITSDKEDDAGFEAAVKAETERFLAGRSTMDEDDLPAHSHRTLQTTDDTDLGYIQQPLARRACSAEERRRAKDKGLFGLVVEYVGYWFDHEDSSVYGDVTMKEGVAEISYDALLRAQTSASSERYVSTTHAKPVKMVVVGQTEPKKFNSGKPYLLLAEIQKDDVVRHFDIPKNRVVN